MSSSINIPFAHSAIISPSPTAAALSKITLISSSSSSSSSTTTINGEPLQVFGQSHPIQPYGVTIVDCNASDHLNTASRIDISSSNNSNNNQNKKQVSAVVVPHVTASLLDGGILRKVREARSASMSGQSGAPRILVVGTSSASTYDGGLSRWVTEHLVRNENSFPNFGQGTFFTSSSSSSHSNSNNKHSCATVADLSLNPMIHTEIISSSSSNNTDNNENDDNNNNNINNHQQGGSCSLRFYSTLQSSSSASKNEQQQMTSSKSTTTRTNSMNLMESYNFYLGTTTTSTSTSTQSLLETALLETATAASSCFTQASASSLEVKSGGFIVNMGDVCFASPHHHHHHQSAEQQQKVQEDYAAANTNITSSSSSLSLQMYSSLIPKLVRQLNISHIALVLSPSCHPTAENQKMVDVIRSATESLVRGVSVDIIRFPYRLDISINNKEVEETHHYATYQTLQATLFPRIISQHHQQLHARRIVLKTEALDMRNALTLEKINSTCDVKLNALCAVAAPTTTSTMMINNDNNNPDSASSSVFAAASRRLIVGYVVVVEKSPDGSCLVVLIPSSSSSSSLLFLPSQTLLISNDIVVPSEYLPSVVESY